MTIQELTAEASRINTAALVPLESTVDGITMTDLGVTASAVKPEEMDEGETWLQLDSTGTATAKMAYYRDGDAYLNCPAFWRTGGAWVRITGAGSGDAESTRMYVPALTAASSGGYTASSNSEAYASTTAWHAFDGKVGENDTYGWQSKAVFYGYNASTETGGGLGNYAAPYIQLQMTSALKKIEVSVLARATSPNAPRTGYVELSNDGTTWVNKVDFDVKGNTAGNTYAFEKLALNNTTGYKYVRLTVTAHSGGSGQYTSIGEMYISGIPVGGA